jgi:hypothetical protein
VISLSFLEGFGKFSSFLSMHTLHDIEKTRHFLHIRDSLIHDPQTYVDLALSLPTHLLTVLKVDGQKSPVYWIHYVCCIAYPFYSNNILMEIHL